MLPPSLASRLRMPIVVAPLFLVSGPALVIEACRSGIMGSFPTLNARSPEMLDQWLREISTALAQPAAIAPAPYAVNLIVHHTNTSLKEHLEIVARHRVPVVITSLGAVREVIDAIHSYKGLVFHDVTNAYHAGKAVRAGVDGLVAVCAGAGGHAGPTSPLALIPQLRALYATLPILAAGAISDGATVRAVQTLGADLAYMGTRFIATKEALAPEEYKRMIVETKDAAKSAPPTFLPIVYTDRISGVPANFLRESLKNAGMDPDKLAAMTEPVKEDFSKLEGQTAWRDIWSAGHGSLNIKDVPSVKELVARLRTEYRTAVARESGELGVWAKKSNL